MRALALGEINARRANLDSARERVQRFEGAFLREAQRAAEAAEFAYSRGAIGVMDLLVIWAAWLLTCRSASPSPSSSPMVIT